MNVYQSREDTLHMLFGHIKCHKSRPARRLVSHLGYGTPRRFRQRAQVKTRLNFLQNIKTWLSSYRWADKQIPSSGMIVHRAMLPMAAHCCVCLLSFCSFNASQRTSWIAFWDALQRPASRPPHSPASTLPEWWYMNVSNFLMRAGKYMSWLSIQLP